MRMARSFAVAFGLCWLGLMCLAAPAAAQTVTAYRNSTDSAVGGISGAATPCTARFTRTFNVATGYVVADVDIGVLAAHARRSDLVLSLVSPAGTRVQLASGAGGTATNFNARFDDEAVAAITSYTGSATATATTIVPPYAASFRPGAALSAFDGEGAMGTWTLEICDQTALNSGTFYQADLFLTAAPAAYADLSLAATVSNTAPATGAEVIYTLTVANSGSSPSTASGVAVQATLHGGVSYVSHSGNGSFDPATRVWTIGTLAPGQSAQIDITVVVVASAGTSVASSAEIRTADLADLDSTPNNGVIAEDDYAAVSFTATATRAAGTAPMLVCPAGTLLFDWDSRNWTAGSTSNAYALTGIGSVAFAITNPALFLSNASLGGQSPARQNFVTGGLSAAEYSLAELVDLANTAQVVTNTISLGTVVGGAQLRLFDVDYGAGQFADRVTVTGYRGGLVVMPVLTNGVSNYVIGNTAYGDGTSDTTSDFGNVVVTFTAPIDQIVIAYGNHALAPANPGQQAIMIHDLVLCRPIAAISVTKVSTVLSDPVNGATFPKAIPGAVVDYCIRVSNAGPAGATGVVAGDSLPAGFTYAAGTLRSGTTCSTAATIEDEDAIGADETDPVGVSLSGTTVTMTATTLSSDEAFAIRFRGTVN